MTGLQSTHFQGQPIFGQENSKNRRAFESHYAGE